MAILKLIPAPFSGVLIVDLKWFSKETHEKEIKIRTI